MEKSIEKKSIDFLSEQIEETFGLKKQDVRTYSPLTLAFIGDGIYDLIIRTMIVGKGNTQANTLHQKTSRLVKAATQSAMMEYLEPVLSEEELAVYKRGRNAKSGTMAKNATMADYRRATGLEALCGYLYLQNRMERLLELVKLGLIKLGQLKPENLEE